VILAYGAGDLHVPLLASLLGAGVAPEALVVVHNPASAEDRPGGVPGVPVIRNRRNLGYAGAMNIGIRHQLARGARHVLLLTHDTRPRPGALAALGRAAARSPEFGVLGPALCFAGSERAFSYGGRTARDGSVGHVLDPPAPGRVAACDWIDGSAMLLRADALAGVGLLDDRFFMYFEETDLCLRMRRGGWSVGVVVEAIAEQEPGRGRRIGAFTYLMTRNGTEYARCVAGTRGVAAAVRRVVLETPAHLGAVVRRSAAAAESRVVLAAMWLGLLDFARRRFGPPPARLAGLGDVAVEA
jgi:GT2 family glycosyltransferase